MKNSKQYAFRSLCLLSGVLSPVLLSGFALPARAQPAAQSMNDGLNAVIKKMREEKLSPQAAFDQGILTKKLLVMALGDTHIIDPGRPMWSPTQESTQFAAVVIEHFPEVLEDPLSLNQTAQARLAIYLMDRGDKRGPELMETIIDDMPRNGVDLTVLDTMLYRLSSYYHGKGEYAKAIATSLRVKEFTTNAPMVANILLNGARAATSAGDKAGAKKLYDEIIAQKYGWATGHAYSDMANQLIQEGKVEEARELMKRPLEGDNGDQFRVIMNGRLAQSYFETAEWDLAAQWAQATIDQYKSLANPLQNHGLEYSPESAKRLLQEIEQWKKSPVMLAPETITTRSKGAGETIRTYFNVQSYRKLTITVESPDKSVKISDYQLPYGFENKKNQMFGLDITPEKADADYDTELTLKIAEFPDKVIKLPVKIIKPAEKK
jgi:tetratricopeptide (TPR) repeat protein